MTRRALAVVAAALAAGAAAAPPAAGAATPPSPRVLVADGPAGRTLLGGTWLFRRDPGDVGLRRRWERSGAGWSPVTVPNAWNAQDLSPDGYVGGVAWYRRDLRLPERSPRLTWRVRFGAVNTRATVWLNGRRIGRHTGAWTAFELPLPGRLLRRAGPNRLVVRVDNRRLPTDLPPSEYSDEGEEPRGGWWNDGGIVREVELRRIDRLDLEQVRVRPRLACPTCPAEVEARVVVRNLTGRPRRVRPRGAFGFVPLRFRARTVPAGGALPFRARAELAQPRLWWPKDPFLYPVTIDAGPARHTLRTGIRSVTVTGGRLLLNGRPLNARGVALHEDAPGKGAALDDADRNRLVGLARAAGATMLRSHYPLHPQLHEIADREGLLVWSEVPVYRLTTEFLVQARRDAVRTVRRMIRAHEHHPSIITWSIGNELDGDRPPGVRAYVAAAARAAKALDPTRPVGLAIAAVPSNACAPGLGPVDVIGMNDYFGWYGGEIARRERLSGYLDRMRRCHARQALMVTEFGAEANREGLATEKGTYAFQRDFVRYHLGVYARKPWLSGAIYWTLREFRCVPGWGGGNPRPEPPMHQKGVVAYDGRVKPAFADLEADFRATDQLPGQPPPPASG